MAKEKSFGEKVIEKVGKYVPNPTMIMPSKEYNQIKELEAEERAKAREGLGEAQESGTDYPAGYHKR